MWIFTKKGFFSIVEVQGKPGTYLVRARFRGHLEALLPESEIEERDTIPRSDYRFRAWVDRWELEMILQGIAFDLDYTNYKASLPAGRFKTIAETIWRFLKKEQDLEEQDEARAYRKFHDRQKKGEGHGKAEPIREHQGSGGRVCSGAAPRGGERNENGKGGRGAGRR